MTAVSIPVDERSGSPTDRGQDPILANRSRILSFLAPSEPAVVPAAHDPIAPPAPVDDYQDEAPKQEPTRVLPADPDAGARPPKAVPAPDFFQHRTPEDDDLLTADDDGGDEWPAKPATAAPAPGWKDNLASRVKAVSWKSPKTIAILVGISVVVIVVILLCVLAVLSKSGPAPLEISKKEDSPSQPNKPVAPPPIADGPIKVKSAGEPCKSGGTDPMKAFDGSLDTAWTCKVPYGLGKVLPATLDGPTWVTKVAIVPGYSKIESTPGGGSKDLWNEYSTICAVRFLFDGDTDGGGVILKTGNTRDYVPLTLPKPRLTNTVRMVVTCITPPPSQDGMLKDPTSVPTFATSEIQIVGHPASPNSTG